jgi:hypothetical protein
VRPSAISSGPPVDGWLIDRRTFLKALTIGGASLVVGPALLSVGPLSSSASAQSDAIGELALELEFDPERIFRYVAEEIRYEPYAGLLRGAEGARLSGAGNSVDQAVLLAALLQASGVQTRFREGVLDQTIAEGVLASSRADAETIRQQVLDAITRIPPSGTAAPQAEDPAIAELVAKAVSRGDAVIAWARDEVARTEATIRVALETAGITLPDASVTLPELERSRHLWVQMAAGPAWLDLDPSVPGAAPGATFATDLVELEQIPDDLRHRVVFTVVGERVVGDNLAQETLLEVAHPTDVLTGLAIGFLNVERDGLKALGAAITSGPEGGTTYLPCLAIGERVLVGPGSVSFGRKAGGIADVFGGPSPTASDIEGEPTAEWLELRIESPGNEPVVVRREIFDRIGPAAREAGPDLATFSRAELVALEPGAPLDFMPAQTSHWLTVETGIVPFERVDRLVAAQEEPDQLTTPVQLYHIVRDATAAALADDLAGRHFLDGPNITSLSISQELRDGELSMRPVLDIWHRSVARVPVSEQTTNGGLMSGGVLAHVAEQLVGRDPLADGADSLVDRSPTVGSIFEAARRAGIDFRAISARDQLSEWSAPPDAMSRLGEAIERGWVAVVPDGPVTIGGSERLGWWLVNPATGMAVDQLDTGGGSVDAETAFLWRQAIEAERLRRIRTCIIVIAVITAASLTLAAGGVARAATARGGRGAAAGALASLAGGAAGGIGIPAGAAGCPA